MIRYEDEKRGWWVEIEGAPDMPMSAITDLYASLAAAAPVLARVVQAHNLADWDGQPVELATCANISRRQLAWLREKIKAAILDEVLDPEA